MPLVGMAAYRPVYAADRAHSQLANAPSAHAADLAARAPIIGVVVSPDRDPDLHAALFDLLVPESRFSGRRRALNFQTAVAPLLTADSSAADARTIGELRNLRERLAEGLGGSAWIDDLRSREWSEARAAATRLLTSSSAEPS